MSQLRILIPGSAFAALSALLCLWAWWREAQAPCVPSYQVILDSAPPRYLGGPCSPTTRAERFDEAALLMVGTAAILVSVAMLI